MAEHSSYQQNLIRRYYDRQGQILLARLEELVGALFLADSDAETERLWRRVDKTLIGLKTPASLRTRLLAKRDAEALARQVRDWLGDGKRGDPPS